MAGFINKFVKISIIALCLPGVAFSAQAPNPRGGSIKSVVRPQNGDTNESIRRSATSVIARTTALNNPQKRTVVSARHVSPKTIRSVNNVNTTTVSRAAARKKTMTARTADKKQLTSTQKSNDISRGSSRARATAVFSDVSKISGGYASCRDSYATCMDQFCAGANDTYRRCFCSDRFQNFRDTSDAMDTALQMLADFQDNNLNAVDKTAAEVNAMYTASAGEAAIKKDKSASQKLLDNIADVMSGKKTIAKQQGSSLGILDLSSFSSSLDDVWGGGSDSIFGGGDSYVSLSEMEGKKLYDNANKQCAEITHDSCNSDAMFNLARSAYSIMITQDCNLYEKNINAKKESLNETIRTAEKYLREARLEEYRSHNSADVNACLTEVEKAMRNPVACGEKYEKCMDYTGLYINSSTGEPIYSKALFGLNNIIVLNGDSDVLKANPDFNKWLDQKKIFATSALDKCRDIADTVWTEFKRSGLIQIAQAQDEKIEEVKDSCVATMKECYDKQSGDLKSMDDTEAQATGGIAAMTARGMCYDKVMACAALYGDPDGCKYEDKTKKIEQVNGKTCGLQSLLAYVDTVDSVKVAEGCETALTKYAHKLCDTDEEGKTYPQGCDTMDKNELRAAMVQYAKTFCPTDLMQTLDEDVNTIRDAEKYGTSQYNIKLVNRVIKDIFDELELQFSIGCENLGGSWYSLEDLGGIPEFSTLKQDFYKDYYGVSVNTASDVERLKLTDKGFCIDNDKAKANQIAEQACTDEGGTWNKDAGECSWDSALWKWCNNLRTAFGLTEITESAWKGLCILDNMQWVDPQD